MLRTKDLLAKRASASTEEIFQAVCIDLSESVDADLTSVWTFDSKLSQVECQCCYDTNSESFSSGQILKRVDYPNYFTKIVEDSLVNAPYACRQYATKELADSYFIPNGIKSLLDFILHVNLSPIGVICCENRRYVREWSNKDVDYLRAIASLTSFLFIPR